VDGKKDNTMLFPQNQKEAGVEEEEKKQKLSMISVII
jgi:hypothetical protein